MQQAGSLCTREVGGAASDKTFDQFLTNRRPSEAPEDGGREVIIAFPSMARY
jgi:hypothetical protein